MRAEDHTPNQTRRRYVRKHFLAEDGILDRDGRLAGKAGERPRLSQGAAVHRAVGFNNRWPDWPDPHAPRVFCQATTGYGDNHGTFA
jgi:hypothetical protein